MGNPKVLKLTLVCKLRTTVGDNPKDLKALQNKINWTPPGFVGDLDTGEVTGVEIVTASVDK